MKPSWLTKIAIKHKRSHEGSVSDRAANWQLPVACYANRSSATAVTRTALLTDPPHAGY